MKLSREAERAWKVWYEGEYGDWSRDEEIMRRAYAKGFHDRTAMEARGFVTGYMTALKAGRKSAAPRGRKKAK